MVTLTMQPRFSHIKTKFLDDGIEIYVPTNPDIPALTLTSNLSKFDKNSRLEIVLYGEKCTMYDCGLAGQEWLEKFFDLKGFKFLYFPSEVGSRSVSTYKPKYPWVSTAGDLTDMVGCANFAPFLLGSESSLKDLNDRIKGDPLKMINFRPNIIIEGTKPWDEDDWEYVFINNVCFKRIKDCTRCPMTTLDPQKGKLREDGEPLKTLQTFRTKPEEYGNKTMFGLNVLTKRSGKITVGDAVYVIRTSDYKKGFY
ncbi:DgyrCDS11758 [Dimorphilus gyrociliatus]|uniref:DgyrCDS11758 n=1 Tax=Dimorphilus gyrociliatus TaxID=2664684 RepID=A0A7I8W6X5_9ANNE|nr:DgyrCDS11758 [Dimorphilus gyrociliatus]